MPRNGSGVYTPPSPENPVVASTLIEATKFNTTMTDIATALTNSIAVDGQSTVTANIPMNGNKITGLGAPTTSGDALRQAVQSTFTPRLVDSSFSGSEGQTYTAQLGYYAKYGNTVFFNGYIKMSGLGTLSGDLYIDQLPFTAIDAASGSVYVPVSISVASGLAITAGQVVVGSIEPGSNRIVIELWDATTGTTNLTTTELSADGGFMFSGFYQVA